MTKTNTKRTLEEKMPIVMQYLRNEEVSAVIFALDNPSGEVTLRTSLNCDTAKFLADIAKRAPHIETLLRRAVFMLGKG
ncbi:MAG: hypothetical protein IJS19_06425 [Muribaculaceae bacterium]|nr:hypothetical protein [Muribaculaceae bacterium]